MVALAPIAPTARARSARLAALGQLLGQSQQDEDDGLLALAEDQRRLLGSQMRPERGRQRCRVRSGRIRRGHACS
jgi:hypothetical protein